MSRKPPPDDMRGYFDEDGVLLLWPARGRTEKRRIALAWIASHFEPEQGYREAEVNELIKSLHAFNDHAFLRRELVDRGFLSRNPDGSDYRVLEPCT